MMTVPATVRGAAPESDEPLAVEIQALLASSQGEMPLLQNPALCDNAEASAVARATDGCGVARVSLAARHLRCRNSSTSRGSSSKPGMAGFGRLQGQGAPKENPAQRSFGTTLSRELALYSP
jgi:hypothetical protein